MIFTALPTPTFASEYSIIVFHRLLHLYKIISVSFPVLVPGSAGLVAERREAGNARHEREEAVLQELLLLPHLSGTHSQNVDTADAPMFFPGLSEFFSATFLDSPNFNNFLKFS